VGVLLQRGLKSDARELVLEVLGNLEQGSEVSNNALHFHKQIRKEHQDLLKGRKVKLV